ncbi:hypothetical protein EDD18DRAFT_1074335 [Armillaria luteobubalina]|uniref:Uncharacterized protein n=1 Tax=Armillaria luteobubalina TaxID=153913 RepID=A0AA39Q4S9_9AGAR|nr:hypothetical protein EDD18DRAFT_1074335 [Armillaria luteobubalina]
MEGRRKGCQIAELVQYSCKPGKTKEGTRAVDCLPIVRLFRICAGKPAVEITRVVTISDQGEVIIPRNIESVPSKGPFHTDSPLISHA